ncbi:MAG: hypothetical protein ACP5FT_02900 [Acidilobus sp.]
MSPLKARVEKRGNLAFIVTELGQKAVVPWDTLCNIIARYGLEVEVVGGEAPKCISSRTVTAEEVSLEVEPSEESDEDEG